MNNTMKKVFVYILSVYGEEDTQFCTTDLMEELNMGYTLIRKVLDDLLKRKLITNHGCEMYSIGERYFNANLWDGANFIESIIYGAFKESPHGCSTLVVMDGVDWQYLRNDNGDVLGLLFHNKKED